MVADNSGKFQVKVRFNLSNGREKTKLSQFIFSELFSNAVDLVFMSHEITDMFAFGFEAKCHKFNSFHSLSAES